jgi:hypothetical protein
MASQHQDELPPASLSQSTPTSVEETPTRSCLFRTFLFIKMTLSVILILFSVVIVSAAIFTKQTDATAEYGVQPIVALFVFWLSLAWLAILEGGLNAMVGLQPIPKSVYQQSHRKAYLCAKAAHKGGTIERFIVGRQYLDLTIVFSTSFMVSAVDNARVLGLPPIVNDIFLGSGLAVILCTIVFGQLIAVINCTHNMLDYINNWCMVASTYLALTVEWSGILHGVYLVQIIFNHVVNRNKKKSNLEKNNETNKKIFKKKQSDVMEISEATLSMGDGSSNHQSNNSEDSSLDSDDMATPPPQKPMWQRVLFWARIVFSMCISAFAVAVFSISLVQGNTTLRSAIPVPVSFLCLIILLLLGGIMEALQIALFAVKHLDRAKIEANPNARRNCKLFFSDIKNTDGSFQHSTKLQSFLLGRQIAQTVIMFMIARIISVDMKVEGETLFGVPPMVQKILFDSGLLNALVMTIFASLSWRVTANFFPMLYLGSPISIWIIRLCLLVEGTGICDSAWLLAKIPAAIVRYRSDDYYIAQAMPTVVAAADDEEQEQQNGKLEMGYHKQASAATESLDSSSSCGGSCRAISKKEEVQS